MNGAMSRRQIRGRPRGLNMLLVVISAVAFLPYNAHADAETMLAEAESHYGVGEYEQALTVIDQVLIGTDTSAEQRLDAYVLKARCLTQLDRGTDAKSAYTAALGINDEWRPDAILMPDTNERELFEEALHEYQQSQSPATRPVAASKAPTSRDCPSRTAPLIATGVLTAATIYFIVAKQQTGDRWDEYDADPLHRDDLYAEYESALSRQKTAGTVSVACGVVAGYVWWKYFKQHKNCSDSGASISAVSLSVAPDGVVVGWRF
jgi:tetratricopeptide (TPR) repeat protein